MEDKKNSIAPIRRYSCRVCRDSEQFKDFESSIEFTQHFNHVHPELRLNMDDQILLKCALCQSEYKSMVTFNNHCIPKKVPKHNCSGCNQTFSSLCAKSLHELDDHKGEEETEIETDAISKLPLISIAFLSMKNEDARVQFRFISGSMSLARASLPSMKTLKISQRMPLEPEYLAEVHAKMWIPAEGSPAEHCVLLALPSGKNLNDRFQSYNLQKHFITDLQQSNEVGIVDDNGGYVVHIFPHSDFVTEVLTAIAPNLLANVAEIEHLLVIITDKTE